MKDKVRQNIIDNNLVDPGDNLLVGVSGGHDSMSLLYILDDLKEELDYNLLVAHVDHGVRGDLARRDLNFVRDQAEELGLKFYSAQVDMDDYARKNNISPEEAGRALRYGFFREILSKEGKGKIVVGHNRNDQAETLMMRFIRGTGIDGLRGMDYKYRDIIRPILNITREEIEKYIEDEDIPVVIDHTNLENIYTRNKVRLDLIPYIEREFNPNFINGLWTLSRNTDKDVEFLSKFTRKRYLEHLILSSRDRIELEIEGIKSEDIAISQRLIRMGLENLLGNLQGIGEVHIANVMDLVNSERTGKQLDLPNNIRAFVDYDKLVIVKAVKKTTRPSHYKYKLELGINNLEEIGLRVRVEAMDREKYKSLTTSEDLRIFDYDKISGDLHIRNRRNGDRFRPLGMKGSKKIKDFFIDEKISKEERDHIPLIVDDHNIIWVLGYRISDIYKVDKDTRKLLVVENIIR